MKMVKKRFTGNPCILVFLLACVILPGVVYYLAARTPVDPSRFPPIQKPLGVGQVQPVNEDNFCSNCGARTKSKICEKCGTELY